MNVTNRGVVVFIMFIFCFGAYAQTDPPVKVVVIPLWVDEPAKDKVIFITKDRYTGDLVTAANDLSNGTTYIDGLEAGDALCQADADAQGSKVMGKQFKAWLGWPATDPLAGGRPFNVYDLPYVLPNADEYVQSYSSLILFSPWPWLVFAADGADLTLLPGIHDIWTGRRFSGLATADCLGWTSLSNGNIGAVFYDALQSPPSWTTTTEYAGCGGTARVICMEQ